MAEKIAAKLAENHDQVMTRHNELPTVQIAPDP
jgi:hypothetical protein